jgi:hypothetical protein
MRREGLIGACALAPVLALGACTGVGQGTASYDALAAATKACQDKGGALTLRPGYDGQELSSYDCVGARER